MTTENQREPVLANIRQPFEIAFTLTLTEHEAGVLTGALAEHAQRYPEGHAYAGDSQTAAALKEQIAAQYPEEWT